MTTLFRKLLASPSPRRMMVELLLIWLVVDAVILYCAVSPHHEEWLEEVEFLIQSNFFLPLAAQFSTGILWSLGKPGRWSERVLLPAGWLAGIAVLWQTMMVPLTGATLPPVDELAVASGLILLIHGVSFLVLSILFRWCGATFRQLPHQGDMPSGSPWRLSLADLFFLTTAVAMICFAALTIPSDGWSSWLSWVYAGYLWVLLPTGLFVLVAALRRRRLLAYLLWLGIPLALLNGIAIFTAVSALGVNILLQDLIPLALVNVHLLTYPVALILSLEYLRLRGYVFAREAAVVPNDSGATMACAAGDGT